MTTQEFVNKLSRTEGKLLFGLAEESESMLIAKEEFKNGYYNGLNKGLEILKEFGDWVLYNNWEKHNNGKWMNDDFLTIPTTSELLTIFLTEKYGK